MLIRELSRQESLDLAGAFTSRKIGVRPRDHAIHRASLFRIRR